MKIYRYIAALIAAVMLTGCASRNVNVDTPRVDVGYTTPVSAASAVAIAEEQPPLAEGVQPEVTTAVTTTATSATTAPVEMEESAETAETIETTETSETAETEELDTYYVFDYAAYDISESDREFTKQSIFVGDSICRGFEAYDVVSSSYVYARGNLGARTFWDYMFYYGDNDEEIDYAELLSRTEPKFVFLSMGMNDVNMTDEDTFCENYRKIIDATLSQSKSEVYVCAITPICSEFTTNYRIDCFNLKMQDFIRENYTERVHFVDFGKHLRGKDGKLREVFSSGDGIHLAPYAYYIALWEMNRTTKADGVR